ncbi:MAG: TetR/AcrR family transcriptional regulator [Microbacterium sp.]|jgi:AcrR family transcriptional regulator|uniref:TetR/AcrR family transcriptional regulator n=1 Tax=Microbacterium sp. TaxID=51671 RepID=UPI0028295662|nr:TetR/AcrR family transcriptional regulator [Microbacterium sp.]MDR2323637.1 TetR/AcrR family transcriptional regulator [Microbacterium sp.]
MRPSSKLKREAALDAAEKQFLATGYESVTMESIAHESGVAKQTLYTHFGSKRALFLELVTTSTTGARGAAFAASPDMKETSDPRELLRERLVVQLAQVLDPRVLALRRLVIGELTRSPELAEALYRNGPAYAIEVLAELLAGIAATGALEIADPVAAATQLNWLVMGEPINRAMLLGDDAILTRAEIEEHVEGAVDVFLRAYAPRGPSA